jgi:hypothetical protein
MNKAIDQIRRPQADLNADPNASWNTGRVARSAKLAPLAIFLIACSDHQRDLKNSAWKSLAVTYCTAGRGMQTWEARDPAVLESLRAKLNHAKPAGLTMVLQSYTNELRLELASGQRWVLFLRQPTRLTGYDPDNVKNSFSVSIGPLFHKHLVEQIGVEFPFSDECRIARTPIRR